MDRAEQIRRRIAQYHKQLAEGLNGERAVEVLRDLRRLEAELVKIKDDSSNR